MRGSTGAESRANTSSIATLSDSECAKSECAKSECIEPECIEPLNQNAPTERAPSAEESSNWRYDLLQLLLEEHKLEATRSRRSIFDNPEKSLVVIGNDGSSHVESRISVPIIDFVENGGAILAMLELSATNRSDLYVNGLGTFHRGPVLAGGQEAYRTYSDCVVVTDINDSQNLFAGVRTLVTNRAGWFSPSQTKAWDWETVAKYPTTAMPSDIRPKNLLCVGRPRNGRGGMAIVLADSSLLTNNMLWHGDNSRLALRLSELFQNQGRTQFIMERNSVTLDSITERLAEKLRQEQPSAQPPNMPLPKPTLAQLLQIGNIVAKEVIDSNVLNEGLQRQPRNLRRESYYRILTVLLIAAILAAILWKLLTSRSLREFWLARRRQRFSYEIQSGNEAGDYRTAAGYLAQEFCIQWTGSHHSRHWQQALATLMARQPSVTAADRHELTRIVDIASRGCHERMLGPDFQKFGQSIDTLRRFLVAATPA